MLFQCRNGDVSTRGTVHIKVDTGMSRNGCQPEELAGLVAVSRTPAMSSFPVQKQTSITSKTSRRGTCATMTARFRSLHCCVFGRFSNKVALALVSAAKCLRLPVAVVCGSCVTNPNRNPNPWINKLVEPRAKI